MLNHLEHKYNKLIKPDNFIKQFNNLFEFEEWCYIGTIEDLEATLKEFEKYELYEYCSVIKSVIQDLESTKTIFNTENY